jgi:hypothetical protein
MVELNGQKGNKKACQKVKARGLTASMHSPILCNVSCYRFNRTSMKGRHPTRMDDEQRPSRVDSGRHAVPLVIARPCPPWVLEHHEDSAGRPVPSCY